MNIYVDFMNDKYKDFLIENNMSFFRYWDDYAMFLFEIICESDDSRYYSHLEKDIKEYSDFQTGTEREYENIGKRK